MGLLVDHYITTEGFDVSGLYVQVESIRILKVYGGGSYGCLYTSLAYKSFDAKMEGKGPVPIPQFLANAEGMLTADQFYDQTIFGYAYDAIKQNWTSAGYVVQDFYPAPPTPTTYIYDCSGYNFRGFNCAGYDREGYDRAGFNAEGWDREGYGRDGYNAEGYNRQGYDRQGYDRQGYDMMGYDRQGYDRQGFDRQGCNQAHVDKDGNPCPA